MTKTISIVQSNYIPWKGYFDLIGMADEFIILDTVQFTKNDWRNRNKIKTPTGTAWLTIPVKTGGRFGQTIDKTEIADPSWADRHWSKISAIYGKQRGYALYAARLERLYTQAAKMAFLSQVNAMFIEEVCHILGIKTRISSSSEYAMAEGKNERVISLCKAAGGTQYISGPAAGDYLDPAQFEANRIELSFIDYAGYPEYDQIHPPFEHGVSILDLLLTMGVEAPLYLKSGPHRVSAY